MLAGIFSAPADLARRAAAAHALAVPDAAQKLADMVENLSQPSRHRTAA
jgi:UDP-N-acetylglucosamine:LPS N-acetylglucosamine transferase